MFAKSPAFLQINQLPDNNGYIDIKVNNVKVVNTTNTVIHIIDVDEIVRTLTILEENINTVDLSNRQMQKRVKRGSINFVGTAQKWLFGTMDDDGRTEILEHLSVTDEILEHLSVTDENNRNIIKTINKQIIINDSFNISITSLRDSIENDRINIKSAFQEIRKSNIEIVIRLLYLDQLSKLKVFEDEIEIASTKNNFVHPSILTRQDIELFKIDFYKLKLLKIGVMTYKDNSLLIAIQIPDQFITTQLRLLIPVPNKNKFEIDECDENIIEINNVILHYKENVNL